MFFPPKCSASSRGTVSASGSTWWRVVSTTGVCVALALAVTTPQAQATESRELSLEEQAELRAGKLVVRPEKRRGRGGVQLVGGMAWQLIRASADSVYRALIDVPAYSAYLPAAEEVKLLSSQSPETLFVGHKLGFVRASYYVRTVRDPVRRTLRFRMDHEHPSAIRDAWGEFRVSPYGPDQSVLSMVVMADLGEGLVIGLVRENIHAWLLRVPELIKRHVERQQTRPRAPAPR